MLQTDIEKLFDEKPATYSEADFRLFQAFNDELNSGAVRAAEPDPSARSGWRVNSWVKKGILLAFRMGASVDISVDRERQAYFDKATYQVKQLTVESAIRLVPGGSSIRDGCYVARRVTCMPPMFILVLPKRIDNWSLTSLQQRLVKTGGWLIKHARYYWLLLAESHLTRRLFGAMLRRIWALPVPAG